MFESKLLNEVVSKEPIFWAGKHLPSAGINGSQALFDSEGDFRLSPIEHGRYRTVYLVEQDLGLHKQWPLILDEALRLFQYSQRGVLFVRFSETNLLSAFAFAAFLRRRRDFKFELAYQDEFSNGTVFFCIYCDREAEQPSLSSIEFALITDGRRFDAVQRFIASVAAIRGIDLVDWSIAICGPAEFGSMFKAESQRIRYIDAPPEHESRGWITRKKNLIVSTSKADNLLISHDRYEIPNAFLEQLFEFGADFSVIVPGQLGVDGNAFPDWVTIGSQWTRTPSGVLEHGDYSPHCYINGGVIIGKRRVLAATPWSDLLFWGQYEDVEHSRALTAEGITFRLARLVQLQVTTMRPGYISDFARIPNLPRDYVLPLLSEPALEVPMGEFSLGDTVNFDEQTTLRSLTDAGVFVSNADWKLTPAGLVMLRRQADLVITFVPPAEREFALTIYTPAYTAAPFIQIKANGRSLPLQWIESGNGLRSGSAELGSAVISSSRSLVLSFSSDVDSIILKAIGVQAQDAGGSRLPLGFARVNGVKAGIFREGWGEPEQWGIWTVAPVAHMQLPVMTLDAGRDIEISMTATAYGPTAGSLQIVGIACNGIPVACVAIRSRSAPSQFSIRIPRALILSSPMIQLSFTPAFPVSPYDAGQDPDRRLLGFGLIAMDARAI